MQRLNTSKCRSCGALIVWIKTPSGKSMPCDAQAKIFKYKPGSDTKLVTPAGEVVSCEVVNTPKEADDFGYVPHWSTCNAPDKFRKRSDK